MFSFVTDLTAGEVSVCLPTLGPDLPVLEYILKIRMIEKVETIPRRGYVSAMSFVLDLSH